MALNLAKCIIALEDDCFAMAWFKLGKSFRVFEANEPNHKYYLHCICMNDHHLNSHVDVYFV